MSEQASIFKPLSNEEKIFRFIRDYGVSVKVDNSAYYKRVGLDNVRLFSKLKHISPQDMGFILKTLKDKGLITLTRNHGYNPTKNGLIYFRDVV